MKKMHLPQTLIMGCILFMAAHAYAQQGIFIDASFAVTFVATQESAEECSKTGRAPSIGGAFNNSEVVWSGNTFVCTHTSDEGGSTLEGTISAPWSNPYPQSITISNLKYKGSWSFGPNPWNQVREELVFSSIPLEFSIQGPPSYNYACTLSGDALKQYISSFICVKKGWGTMSCTGEEIANAPDNYLTMSITMKYPSGETSTTTTIIDDTTTTTIGETTSSSSSTTTTANDFMVTGVTPAKGAKNVAWEDPDITAQFSKAVDPKTVNSGTCTVQYVCCPSQPINGTFSRRTDDSSKITFTPSSASEITSAGWNIQVTVRGGKTGVKSLTGDTLTGDYTWTFSTMPALSLEIVPVQVIDGIDLIQNKETVLRVKASWSQASDVLEVPAKVTLIYEDAGYSIMNESAVFYSDSAAGQRPAFQRRGNSVNFYSRNGDVPIIATAGSHTIKAIIEPTGQNIIPPPKTFSTTQTVKVRKEKTFRVIYYPINSRQLSNMWDDTDTIFTGSTFASVIANSDKLISKLYPVTASYSRLRSSTIYNILQVPGFFPEPDEVNGVLDQVEINLHLKWVLFSLANLNRNGAYDAVVGVVPRPWLDRLLGSVGSQQNILPFMFTTYACLIVHDAKPQVAPHEIGHIYLGLDIPNCDGEGHDPRGVTFTGYDLIRDRYVAGRNAGWSPGGPYSSSLMDTAIDGAFIWDTWISKDSYQILLNRLTSSGSLFSMETAAESGTVQVLQVMGHISADAQGVEKAELQPIYTVSNASPSVSVSGQYAVELQSAVGVVLKSYTFEPTLQKINDGTNHDIFLINLENAPTGAQIVVRHNSTVLATVKKSKSAPTVNINSPAGGQSVQGSAAFTWTASDEDGDALTFDALFSSDGGQTWDILEQNIKTQSITVDTTWLRGGVNCKIKVLANDGFNTTEAVSGTFTVGNPPIVLATSPEANAADVPPESSIAIIFRDPMDETTVTKSSIVMQSSSGNAIDVSVSYETNAYEAVFVPNIMLEAKTAYSVIVTTQVKNVQGFALGSTYTFSFTTGERTLQPETTATTTVPGGATTTTTTATDSDNQTGCPAAQTMGQGSHELRVLRSLRDRVFSKSSQGQQVISSYYRHADQVSLILTAQPDIRAALKQLILKNIATVSELVLKGHTAMEQSTVKDMIALIEALQKHADSAANSDLANIKKKIRDGSFLQEIGVTVVKD